MLAAHRIRAALGATLYTKDSIKRWQELFIASVTGRKGKGGGGSFSKDKRTRILASIARDAPDAAPATLDYAIRFADRVLTACVLFRMLEVRYQNHLRQGAPLTSSDHSAASQRAVEWCRCVFAAELTASGLYAASHVSAQTVNIYDEYDIFRIGMAHQRKQWTDYLFTFLHDTDSMHGGVFVKNYMPVVLNDFFAAVSRGAVWYGVKDETGATANAISTWLKTNGTFMNLERVADVTDDVPDDLKDILDLSLLSPALTQPSDPVPEPDDTPDTRGDAGW